MKPRLSTWLGGRQKPLRQNDSNLYNDSVVDASSTGPNYLLAALRSRAPGAASANMLELSRHLTSSIFLAINTLQKHAAAAEMKVMEETHDPDAGDMEVPHTDPAYQFFKNPNSEDDWPDIADGLTQQISLTGTALLWTPVENEGDVPSEMYVIPTASALPWPPSPVYPHGSYLIQPYYPYGPFSTIPSYQSAAGARIPGEQIVRIKNTHPLLRYDGYAVLTAIGRIIDTVEAIDLARWTTQQKGIDSSMMITLDQEVLNPNKLDLIKLRNQIEAVAAGPANAGKFFFVPAGTSVSKVSQSPSEMAWESGWDQLISFALACFGVPKAVAGLSDDANYATLYASLKQFYILSLSPLLRKLSGRMTKRIVRPSFGEDLYLKLTPERIDDRDHLLATLDKHISAGNTMRVDEFRKSLDMKPFGGEEGKAFVGGKEAEQMMQDKMMKEGKLPQDESGKLAMKEEEDQNEGKPINEQGKGSLGPRKRYNGNRMAEVLDTHKHNGTVKPIGAYNDGATEFLRK